ncbi:MAG: DinB family protein [Pseudomonadota bacterium]
MTTTFPKPALVALCDDNDRCLAALSDLVSQIAGANYSRPLTPCDAGIGAHVRHVLDHYDALLQGIKTGVVNYDTRARCPETETDADTALDRIAFARHAIRALGDTPGDTPLSVCLDCGTGGTRPTPSTLARELQFLVSHTVHHDALIAAAARTLGATMEDGFGVAPSTLKANASTQAG